ncbi:hydroxymethylglutaryl-CoA lyase [Bacillus kwashiorkori]|uniref:hydroxymethylglutaryl-CoA lyase n=1 Tax=Bacillus kwashiorkori TaxID=1522318 RepID=UPI000780C4FB|nr:hydroxymethylglutaryl-CoA lyase [Bacillus kwashiorkori]
MILPEKVTIIEVGPRDGLQNENDFVPTEKKLDFIRELQKAGFQEMEITSFVSPKWVPQMADSFHIATNCGSTNIRNFILVPNKRGIDQLLQTNIKAVAIFVGVSDSFNKKNINRSLKESLQQLAKPVQELKDSGFFVRVCISTAFYCPYEGKISEERVIDLCNQFVQLGVDELSIADTIGMASPLEAYSLFTKLKATFPEIFITAHFHDTRKMGLANIFASLQAGVDRFDCSTGGLGGCPFAPGASGNVATEDVVYMLGRLGIQTGINLNQLVKAIDVIQPHISRKIDSAYYQAYKKSLPV